MKSLTTELWRAMLEGDYDLADHLIHRGADVNVTFNGIQSCLQSDTALLHLNPMTTLLHLAVMTRNVPLVPLLIKHGANCNARDIYKETPLHLAVLTKACPTVVEDLIDGGAVVDARSRQQLTPLHLAVMHGNNEMALKLIAEGASIEAVDTEGWNTLHFASLFQNLTMAKVLISRKIDIDAEDIFGKTPLHYAIKSTDIIKILLDNGADMEKRSREGLFPLHLATLNCRAALHLLLKRGACVNQRTRKGQTALHMACEFNISKAAALLLKFGADLNARNRQGKAPFELLANSSFSRATAKVVIREAVKREAFGEPLCEEYIKMAQSQENYSKFDQECREEIKRMRSERIDVEDSTVSFFDIFSKNIEKLAAPARNQNIVAAFETSNFVTSSNIYGFELIAKFEMAKRRANFLISVENILMDALGDILPVLVVQKIAVHVKDNDTRRKMV